MKFLTEAYCRASKPVGWLGYEIRRDRLETGEDLREPEMTVDSQRQSQTSSEHQSGPERTTEDFMGPRATRNDQRRPEMNGVDQQATGTITGSNALQPENGSNSRQPQTINGNQSGPERTIKDFMGPQTTRDVQARPEMTGGDQQATGTTTGSKFPQPETGNGSMPEDSLASSNRRQWRKKLVSAHYWDCSGHSCDATHLQPWDANRFVTPPEYAPMDPENYGGSKYGEKIWMMGATSDAVSQLLGPDANNCGSDKGGSGGCGQCLLIKNLEADNKDWTAVVMKKRRCNPWSPGCGDGGFHLDVAVPGFDRPEFGNANVCGRPGTSLSRKQSSLCGGVAPRRCNCSGLPEDTAAQRRMKAGCELFRAWGWVSGTPTLEWRPVPCPSNLVEQVQLDAAFGPRGPITVTFDEVSDKPVMPLQSASVTHITAGQLLNPRPVTLFAVAMIFFLPSLSMLLFVVVYRLRQRRRQYHEQVDTEAQALVE